MRQIKLLTYMLAAFFVVSCTSDDGLDIMNDQCENLELTVEMEPYVMASSSKTRAYFTDIDEGESDFNYGFKFEKGDTFGICSTDGSLNIPITVKSAFAAGKKASFNLPANVTTNLSNNIDYIIYYPYSERYGKGVFYYNSYWHFRYDDQMQSGDGESDIIANENNYYVSAPIKYNANKFSNVKLSPVGSVIHLRLHLPAGQYVRVGLENVGTECGFCMEGIACLGNNGLEFPQEFPSNRLSLKLEGFNVKVEEDEEFYDCDFYMMAYPTSTGNFRVKVTNAEGVSYYSEEIYNLDLNAGKCYFIDDIGLEFPSEAEHEYVDLGLPSGTMWATMNVGATSTTEYGNHYAWGETKGYGEVDETNVTNRIYNDNLSYLKTYYDWNTYKFCYGTNQSIWRYMRSDEKTELDVDDDAASLNWGGRWHTPTHAELSELRNNCFWVWTDNYMDSGVRGYIVYKAEETNKGELLCINDAHCAESYWRYTIDRPHIFLPASGYVSESNVHGGNGDWLGNGYYMTSSLGTDIEKCKYLYFWCYGSDKNFGESSRFVGLSIRPVFKK